MVDRSPVVVVVFIVVDCHRGAQWTHGGQRWRCLYLALMTPMSIDVTVCMREVTETEDTTNHVSDTG